MKPPVRTLLDSMGVLVLALLLGLTVAQHVAVLGNHNPNAWGENCTASDAAFTACNLSLYAATAALASSTNASLLVFPEAYALARLYKGAVFEPLISTPGGAPPCDAAAAGAAPQQAALSCLARQHGLVLAANVFVALANGTQRIAEIVLDATGAVAALYFKHHLFPNEDAAGVAPGPFAPTTFAALGRTWGLIICYEGVYPFLSGDFAQMEGLAAAGATGFIWSVGGDAPIDALSALLAEKFRVDVVGSMDASATPSGGAIYNASGAPYAAKNTRVVVGGGYTGAATLRTAVLH